MFSRLFFGKIPLNLRHFDIIEGSAFINTSGGDISVNRQTFEIALKTDIFLS